MKKDLKTLALARLSGFRHKTVKVPEWGNVSVVLREPSAEAWYLWQEVLNGDGEDDDTLSVVAKTRRNLEADVTLFCDVLCDTDLQRVFTPCNQVNHLIPTRVLVKGVEITCKILK
ncbi:phage tail assembly chaperone [Escherichia coli]